jgi:hypothetical protein
MLEKITMKIVAARKQQKRKGRVTNMDPFIGLCDGKVCQILDLQENFIDLCAQNVNNLIEAFIVDETANKILVVLDEVNSAVYGKTAEKMVVAATKDYPTDYVEGENLQDDIIEDKKVEVVKTLTKEVTTPTKTVEKVTAPTKKVEKSKMFDKSKKLDLSEYVENILTSPIRDAEKCIHDNILEACRTVRSELQEKFDKISEETYQIAFDKGLEEGKKVSKPEMVLKKEMIIDAAMLPVYSDKYNVIDTMISHSTGKVSLHLKLKGE